MWFDNKSVRRGRAIVGVAAGTAALMMLAACGGGSGSDSKDSNASAGAVDKNATLRAAFVALPNSLDPFAVPSEAQAFPYLSPVYDRLTQMKSGKSGMELAPMIATEWTYSDDGKELTFTLRDDATFSDGTKVDAAAVKASLESALTREGSTAATSLSAISSIAAPDATTLVISMDTPSSDLPALLSGGYGAIVNPKALNNKDLDVNPQGSGGYTAEVKRGVSVTYTRRDGYWDPEAVKSKTIVLTGIIDSNARLNAIRSGQSDIVDVQPPQYKAAKSITEKDSKLNVVEYQFANNKAGVSINQNRKYMDDVRVRQALNYAVDRDAIVESIYNGVGRTVSQTLGFSEDGYLPELDKKYTLDVAKAKSLLKEAGVPEGYEINILAIATSPVQEIAQAFQDQLTAVGLKGKVDIVEPASYFASWTKDSKYDVQIAYKLTFETPRISLVSQYMGFRGLLNPVPQDFVDAVTAAGDPTISDADRTKLLEEANTISTEGAFDVFVAGAPALFLASDKVVGADTQGRSENAGIYDLRYVGLKK